MIQHALRGDREMASERKSLTPWPWVRVCGASAKFLFNILQLPIRSCRAVLVDANTLHRHSLTHPVSNCLPTNTEVVGYPGEEIKGRSVYEEIHLLLLRNNFRGNNTKFMYTSLQTVA